jgi:hypothetical protein
MRRIWQTTMVSSAVLLLGGAHAAAPPSGPVTKCPPDAVVSGAGCMDKYEASVWRVPNPTTINAGLVTRIQQGTATIDQLMAAGARLLGTTTNDWAPCSVNGQSCVDDVYAVSLQGVTPSALGTWFQAQQACANSRKRLPSNAEWQAAAAGTPVGATDDGTNDCNTTHAATVLTGTRSRCVSARGVFDMGGNLAEWVADWMPASTNCGSWSLDVSPTDENQCFAGADVNGEPAGLVRGGTFLTSFHSGPLSINGRARLSLSDSALGFRCVR